MTDDDTMLLAEVAKYQRTFSSPRRGVRSDLIDRLAGRVLRLHALRAENERLRAAMKLARIEHHECEDPWYSCPKSPDGCANDALPKDKCNCGADEHNAAIDNALSHGGGGT